ADFAAGRVWSIALHVDPASGEAAASDLREHTGELGGAAALGMVSALAEDADGELYVISWDRGRIVRIVSDTPVVPPADPAPAPGQLRQPELPRGRFPGQRRQ